jgi:hypothetical protein
MIRYLCESRQPGWIIDFLKLASTCLRTAMISASVCLDLDMLLPLSKYEIILSFARIYGSRSAPPETMHLRHNFAELRKVSESLPALQPIVTYLEWLGAINGAENVKINDRAISLVQPSH